ncbi:TolC family protein, partial [uncultured Massilia sp.]|uniref:TolC family protein n=1 Tax=uncultured Massilia sp. TaxID=169973 RepID=UPI00258FF0E1
MRALRWLPLALAAAGCTMAPHPRPAPTLQLPAAWRTAPGGEGIVARDWWRAFGDPALDALVQRALDNNGDLRIARSRLEEYRARVRVAQSANQPALNLSFAPTRARVIGPLGQPIDTTSIVGSVQASYELDLFGRIAATTQAARFEELSQEAAFDAAALAIVANTASGYFNLLGLDAQLALARETLASRERSFTLARHQFEVGYSSRLEMSQAEAELHATAAVVPQLERAIA